MAILHDKETGLYYLQSRYYNPETGRFLNADAYAATGQGFVGNNMFAYCNNNPVMFKDPSGLCREVGALLTWIDCEEVDCPTSKFYQPHSAIGGVIAQYTLTTGKLLLVCDVSAALEESIISNKNYVIAYDKRHGTNNPNIQICNSYLITSKKEQTEILMFLLEYDAEYPSEVTWGRTVDSMLIEWDAHNLFAAFDQSARDTDFDKFEEAEGYWYYFTKAAERGYAKYIQPIFN